MNALMSVNILVGRTKFGMCTAVYFMQLKL